MCGLIELKQSSLEIKKYDYMIFNVMLRETLSSPIIFWMDMAVGDVNVTSLEADGSRDNSRLHIFNAANEMVTGALDINVIYTFVLKLGHGDPDSRYAIGFSEDTMLYFQNPIAASEAYVIDNFDMPPS